MPQIVECPKCAKKLNAPDKLAGMRVACPACQAAVSIPSIQTPKQQPSPQQPSAPPRAPASPMAVQTAAVFNARTAPRSLRARLNFKEKRPLPAMQQGFTVRPQTGAAIALASFAWLAFMLERARSSDEEHTPRRVVRAAA
jgi:hypothetical protein